jgi:hypothetical protein
MLQALYLESSQSHPKSDSASKIILITFDEAFFLANLVMMGSVAGKKCFEYND